MRAFGRVWNVLLIGLLALILAGCFQSAGSPIEPTIANATATSLPTVALPVTPPTQTPFITAISTQGFQTAVDNPTQAATNTLPPATTPGDLQQTLSPTTNVPTINAVTSGSPTVIFTVSPSPSPTTANVLNTPTPFATEGPCVHTVQPGEYIYSIARKYNVNPDELLAANPRYAGNPDRMQPGDVLNIPKCGPQGVTPTLEAQQSGNKVYTVAPGDTLGAIARKFGITVQELKQANNLTTDFLSVGQKLIIPGAK